MMVAVAGGLPPSRPGVILPATAAEPGVCSQQEYIASTLLVAVADDCLSRPGGILDVLAASVGAVALPPLSWLPHARSLPLFAGSVTLPGACTAGGLPPPTPIPDALAGPHDSGDGSASALPVLLVVGTDGALQVAPQPVPDGMIATTLVGLSMSVWLPRRVRPWAVGSGPLLIVKTRVDWRYTSLVEPGSAGTSGVPVNTDGALQVVPRPVPDRVIATTLAVLPMSIWFPRRMRPSAVGSGLLIVVGARVD
jgi:hypothetical protein